MRRVTSMLSVAAVLLMAAGMVAQEKPNFGGDWKIVPIKGSASLGST